jgi:sodium transport system permease protein
MIRVESLRKRFGEVVAVDDLSFEANDGRITGLLGPNGAGKTTTLRILAGLIRPDAGRATIDGVDVGVDPRGAQARLGVLPDARGLYPRLSARENIRYYGELHGMAPVALDAAVEAVIARLDMAGIIDRRTEGFSQGERAKVAIARSIVHGPRNLILDEPTNGLDVMSTRAMRELIRQLRDEGMCVVFSSHIMQEVSALCDFLVVVARGGVAPPGTVDDIREQAGKDDLEDRLRRARGRGRGGRGARGERGAQDMRELKAVIRKELRDALRDRRSLLSALLFPLLGPLLIVVMFSYIADTQSQERPLKLAVIGQDNAPTLIRYLEGQGVEIEDPPADPLAAVRDGELDVVLEIPAQFGEEFRAARPAKVRLILDDSSNASKTSIKRTRRLLLGYGQQVGGMRLHARGVDPSLANAIAIDDVDLATPKKEAANLLGMLPMFVLLAGFIGGMYVATDVTAGERERGSLEPLLCIPVSRRALVVGKWLAATAFAAVSIVLTLALTLIAMTFVDLDELGIVLDLGPVEIAGVLAATIPIALLAAAAQLLLATFARTFKEAQTYLSLMMLIPMIPGVVMSIKPIHSALWMMPIPLLGQQVLLMDVLRGEPTSVLDFTLAGLSAVALAVVCLLINARLFEREKIIFGR